MVRFFKIQQKLFFNLHIEEVYPGACTIKLFTIQIKYVKHWLVSLSLLSSQPFLWCHDIQHKDTHHNNTQHNDTQHNDTQHNDTQHNDTQHDDIQHNKTQYNNIQHNHIQLNDAQHNSKLNTTLRIMTPSIMQCHLC
jgi:hypothetical protein